MNITSSPHNFPLHFLFHRAITSSLSAAAFGIYLCFFHYITCLCYLLIFQLTVYVWTTHSHILFTSPTISPIQLSNFLLAHHSIFTVLRLSKCCSQPTSLLWQLFLPCIASIFLCKCFFLTQHTIKLTFFDVLSCQF